jgi:hypothetical protein
MASIGTISTKIGDLRLVLPPGMKVPNAEGGGPPPMGGGEVPSYETDVESWDDQEDEGGGGGAPDPRDELDPDYDKLADDYADSSSADIDESIDKLLNGDEEGKEGKGKGGGEGEGDGEGQPGEGDGKGGGKGKAGKMPKAGDPYIPTKEEIEVFKDRLAKTVDRMYRNIKTRPEEMNNGYNPESARAHDQPPGWGIGKELANTGFRPMRTGLWKEAVKKWFKSLPDTIIADSWTHKETRLSSVQRQVQSMGGGQTRLPARDIEMDDPAKSQVLCFIDISGSVFSKGIQFDFTSIVKAVPPALVDVLIWTFDGGIRKGPMTPKNYDPGQGGGGTEPWEDIAKILLMPRYKKFDGAIMLTDGCFAHPPPNIIRKPHQWCFVMTSEYTADAIPKGAKIIETYIEDPAYQKNLQDAQKKDIFKKAVTKT